MPSSLSDHNTVYVDEDYVHVSLIQVAISVTVSNRNGCTVCDIYRWGCGISNRCCVFVVALVSSYSEVEFHVTAAGIRAALKIECTDDVCVGVGIRVVVLNNHVKCAARIREYAATDGSCGVIKGIESLKTRIAAIRGGIAELSGSDEFDIALSGVRPKGRNHGKGQDRDR